MKTKLFILSGTILAVISAVAMAESQTAVPSWKQDLLNAQSWGKNLPDDVSALLPSMQGIQTEETAYLDDDKVLYVSRPNDLNEKTSRRKIVDNAEYVFDQKGTTVLFGKNGVEGVDGPGGYSLWIADTESRVSREFSQGIANTASISPSGKFVAVSSIDGFKVSLYTKDGMFLKQVTEHGINPVFSPDSKLLAYAKLSNSDLGSGLGIEIYNLETGKETLVTTHKEDWEPLTFSPDNGKLYFHSDLYRDGAQFKSSLWVVDVTSGVVKQLNNIDENGRDISVMRTSLTLSSDGLTLVSATEDGLGIIKLNKEGNVVSAKAVGPKGRNPRWLKQDEIITYSATGLKGKYWEFVSVK